jgi:hypothetical protein
MSDFENRLADLINFSSLEKPIDFEQAFNSVIQNKIEYAINNKKLEVAKSMFATDETEEEEYDAQAA